MPLGVGGLVIHGASCFGRRYLDSIGEIEEMNCSTKESYIWIYRYISSHEYWWFWPLFLTFESEQLWKVFCSEFDEMEFWARHSIHISLDWQSDGELELDPTNLLLQVGWPDQYYRDTSQQYCQYYQYYRDTSQQYYQYNQYYRDTSWKGKMWKNALLTDLSCESLPTCPPSFRLPHKEDNAECCLNKLEPGCTFGAIFGVFDFCTF